MKWIRSQGVLPTSLSALRLEMLEFFTAELNRIPSVREVTAVFRVTESTAKSMLRNLFAVSDRTIRIASSIFASATADGVTGKGGMTRYKFKNVEDLELARAVLTSLAVKHETLSEKDGEYVLAVDPSFSPDGGSH
jgi:hypothetical protein